MSSIDAMVRLPGRCGVIGIVVWFARRRTGKAIDLCRGHASVVEAVEVADEVWLPFIVLGELRAGFAVGSQGPRNEAVLRRFLLKSGVGVLYADEQTTHHYGRFTATAKARHSHPDQRYVDRGPVLQHSLVLCARDAHFDALPQLTRV
jgi:predicted nucleic acid-binding protein